MMDVQIIDIDQRITVFNTPVYIRSVEYEAQRESRGDNVHSYIRLYYNVEGTSELIINHTEKVTVDKGGWVLINRGVIHEERVYGRCAGYALRIITDPKGSALFPKLGRDGYCTGEDDGQTGRMLSLIRREYIDKPRGYAEYCGHLLSGAMISLCRMCGDNSRSGSEFKETKSSDDTQIIEAFFDRVYSFEVEDMSVDRLAGELHMSKRNVNRVLNKWYGKSFQELLLSAKLRLAAHLLVQSDRKVSEICEICGLSEPYFIRSFKSSYGVTPAQYRKKNKK